MHEVLDKWFVQMVQPRLHGRGFLVRYADDFVMGFQRKEDAERVMEVLPKRVGRCGLTLHVGKTRVVPFKRPGAGEDKKGKGRSQSFDFLLSWERFQSVHEAIYPLPSPRIVHS